MAKSAVKPIFSSLPHPTFFAPKSPFFPLFPVLSPFSGDFSMARSRFLPCEAHFFSSFLVLGPTSGDFSMARYSFQPRNSLLPCFSLYFPILRALLREISPFIFSSLPFSHSVKAFPIRFFPFFIICPTFISRSTPPRPSFTPPFTSLPHFFSHSSPLFHLPPQQTHDRAHPRALRATRTPAPTHTSGGFRLLPSPLHPPPAIHCTSMH